MTLYQSPDIRYFGGSAEVLLLVATILSSVSAPSGAEHFLQVSVSRVVL